MQLVSRKILEIWIHGGPQNLIKLSYFDGTHDSVQTPKALASKWTHSGNDGEQRICNISNLLKHKVRAMKFERNTWAINFIFGLELGFYDVFPTKSKKLAR